MKEEITQRPPVALSESREEPQHPPWAAVLLETWLLWIMVTGLFWPLSLIFLAATTQWMGSNLLLWIGLLGGGIIGGAFLAMAQWLVMRPLAIAFTPWVGYSALGWGLGISIAAAALQPQGSPVLWALAIFIGGCVHGLCQWLTMKPVFRGRGEWVFLTGITWGLAVAVGALLDRGPNSGDSVRLASDPAGLGIVGWPVLSVLAFFLFIMIFSTTTHKNSKEQSWLIKDGSDALEYLRGNEN